MGYHFDTEAHRNCFPAETNNADIAPKTRDCLEFGFVARRRLIHYFSKPFETWLTLGNFENLYKGGKEMRLIPIALSVPLIFVSCQRTNEPAMDHHLDKYLSQYAPYEMKFDARVFNQSEQQVLRKLIAAANVLDTIYWMQTSKYGFALLDSLQRLPEDEAISKQKTLLIRNAGPFELLNEHEAFMGNQTYYPGGELYPRGMSAEQFDEYFETLSEKAKTEFMSPYTVIRQSDDGGYRAIPYHVEYEEYVGRIASLLREAADLSENESFARFLRIKADAIENTDKYFDADVAWIDMEGSKFDIVFGPFETYSDGIKGVKAKYEASIEVVDQAESKNLDLYTKYLKEMEENLPIPAEYKSQVTGLTAKFVIVRDILRTGEAAAGYQAVATNLPNDPEVHAKKGTKKTFWKNMFEARFNTIIKPVSLKLIADPQQVYLSDEGFFQFVLMHEICHAVGPRTVKVGSKKGMAANAAIGPDYNGLEEAKADVVGLHSLYYLMDKGVVEKEREREFLVSYLGSLFRSVRFGFAEAHGKAAAIELNYLMENKSLVYNKDLKRWSVDFEKIRSGIKDLSRDLLILEGDGDGQKVQQFFNKYVVVSSELKESLDMVKDIAIDVLPKYTIQW